MINTLLGKNTEGTKSGFGKSRQKIKSELFEWICKRLIGLYYGSQNNKELKRWNGFILKEIDASIVDLIDTPEIREQYGVHKNQHGVTVQGRMMIGYDVLNKIITNSHLGELSIGEITVAKITAALF